MSNAKIAGDHMAKVEQCTNYAAPKEEFHLLQSIIYITIFSFLVSYANAKVLFIIKSHPIQLQSSFL